MKKLRLTVDALQVESFPTAEQEMEQRGTVRGNASDSTCIERRCMCSAASDFDATCFTCNHFENTCYDGCNTHTGCNTVAGFPGC